MYNMDNILKYRKNDILTTFINVNEPRRLNLLNKIRENKMSHNNINNCFEKENLKELYKNTKIIINIHQTEHHHTMEELRVLPALLCGVIVICEKSPLTHMIPYNDYILWSSYDDILNVTTTVLNNYDYYYDLIFNIPKKININNLDNFNYDTLEKKILSIVNFK